MKKLLVAVVVACGFAAFASEWYIDPTNGVDTAAGTQDAPRKTLKGAMEIPELAENDTIWLLPGEYKEGTMGENNTRRLYVDKAGLRFRSTAGRDRTFIVGQHDGSKKYDGDNAISCVKIDKDATGCVFEGITFKDGAAKYQNVTATDDNAGAGLYDGLSKSCWVIGCRFTNCVAYATAGAMLGGNVSGTEFVDCSASNGSSQFAQGLTYAEFCLFDGGSKSASIDQGGTFVNCTFYGNNVASSQLFYRRAYKLYNCLAYGFKTSCGSHQKSGTPTTPDDVTIYNTYFNIYDGNGSVTVGANSLTNADETAVRFVAPAAGDYRLTDDSDAKELGDASHLSRLPATFPEGFERKDVYGNPVPEARSGLIPAGCALEVPHQTGGRVDFTKAFEVKEFGRTFAASTYFNPIREDYTYMFRPVTDDVIHNVQGIFGKELNANKTAWVDLSRYFFPLRRKGGWVPVGVRSELISTNKFTWTSVGTSNIYYADPINGSDDYDGKSSNVVDAAANKGPFKTLTGAMAEIDQSGGNKILYLMPGRYDERQSAERTAEDGVRYRVRVYTANIAIIGLEGPEKTFIVGAPDPDMPDGLGTNAVGGVWLKSGTCKCVQDVTITGCYSSDKNTSSSYQYGGCAFYGGGSPTTYCFDCIISNNTAVFAPVKSYGTMARCKILNNRSKYYICSRETVSSCVFAGNTMTEGKNVHDKNGSLYGCTFDISPEDASHSAAATYYSLVLNKKVGSYLTQGCCDTIPLVADPATFDYRLGTLSPAVLFGDVSARNADTTWRLVCDVNGDKLEIKDGKMTVGAVHSGPYAPCVAISDGGVAGTTVTGGAFGTNVVKSAGEVTLTASLKRPLEGFSVNGEIIPATGMSYTFTPSTDAGAATVVSPVYGTNWFVSASAESDDAPGGTWETARQTIRSATTNAVAGDVIHVAPGEYGEAEGSRLQSSVQTRVIVPANVRLQGEGAPYAAVIRGAAASEPENEYGMGADAVRCVYLSAGATLANFTLTEGHTVTSTSGRGSAVFAANNTTATVVDCLVTNNYCYDGTMYSGRIVKCRIIDNTSIHYGSLGYACSYYGCFLDHSWTKSGRALNAATSIDFCTIGTHHKFGMSTKQVLAPPGNSATSPHPPIRNSVLEWGSSWAATMWSVSNCIFVSDYAFTDTNKCLIMSAANMKLSDDGVPTADSPLNNWGNMEFAPDCINETDLAGVPRVLNGGVDAGAFEHDWRVEYKKDLGARATAVTGASPEVVETNGVVRIPSGALVGTLKPGDAVKLNFTVKGGTLKVYLGEKLEGTFEATEEVQQSVELWPKEGNDAFRLAFTPNAADGYAEIARLKKGASGIIFMVK